MQERREIELPSGAKMRIQVAPFKAAKQLYQMVLKEFKTMEFSMTMEHDILFKNLFCSAFSSDAIEAAVWECLKSCTYDTGEGEKKISSDTFEPVEARDDFMLACFEVVKDNIAPFWKSLWREFAQLSQLVSEMELSRKSK